MKISKLREIRIFLVRKIVKLKGDLQYFANFFAFLNLLNSCPKLVGAPRIFPKNI